MARSLNGSGPALALLLVANGVVAQGFTPPPDPRPALEGYSPVSYFEHGEPQLGSPEYTATHGGDVYYFTSAEQLEGFTGDPDRYAPLFPRHCPYNLALGRAAAIDPTNFRIVADRLLLFHRSEEMDGAKEWTRNDAKQQKKLLERARGNFRLLEF